MTKDLPIDLRGTARDYGYETRDDLKVKYKELEDGNVNFVVIYENHLIAFGFTNLERMEELKTDDNKYSSWKLFPEKIPTYEQYYSKIKWFDDTITKYIVGNYQDSINIKKWVENIWHNIRKEKYLQDPEQNIFKGENPKDYLNKTKEQMIKIFENKKLARDSQLNEYRSIVDKFFKF